MDGPRRRSYDFVFSHVGPVCPRCNYQHIADEAFYFDEGLTQMECEYCDKTFKVSVRHETTWTTNAEDTP